MQLQHPAITRVAVALYDSPTDELKTFIYSSENKTPIENYQAKLSETPQLKALLENAAPRVINDLDELKDSAKQHTKALIEAGYRSSYTLPMILMVTFSDLYFLTPNRKMCLTNWYWLSWTWWRTLSLC